MIYKDSPFYGKSSERYLRYLLKIPSNDYFKQDFIARKIHPYIESKGNKTRLIERPDGDLKRIQSNIKNVLAQLEYPLYVFSGVKRRSIADNAKLHIGNKNLYKIDITTFFPSISREKVFYFFKDKLCLSQNLAEILTNLTTVDILKASVDNTKAVQNFIAEKNIKTPNHLISGSPSSQLLSYLVNQDMFDDLNNLCKKNDVTMSVWVDDIIFSSEKKISFYFKELIKKKLGFYCYKLSTGKKKYHTKGYPKRTTGVIINKDGKMSIPNSLSQNIILCCNKLKQSPENDEYRKRLQGLVEASRQITPNAFPSIYSLAYDSNCRSRRDNC